MPSAGYDLIALGLIVEDWDYMPFLVRMEKGGNSEKVSSGLQEGFPVGILDYDIAV